MNLRTREVEASSELLPPTCRHTPCSAGSKDAASGEATPLSVTSALAARGLVDDSAAAGSEQAAQQAAQPAAAQGSELAAAASDNSPAPPPHPASYLEVLEMLERGQTPPGIRVGCVRQWLLTCRFFIMKRLHAAAASGYTEVCCCRTAFVLCTATAFQSWRSRPPAAPAD